jgi:hypothetical protein
MQDHTHRATALCEAARQLPAELRPRLLDDACQGDVASRRAVEDQLRAFVALSAVPAKDTRTLVDASSLTEREGSIIARYKLLRQIGEGGFGVVYMAEQTTQNRHAKPRSACSPDGRSLDGLRPHRRLAAGFAAAQGMMGDLPPPRCAS